MLFTFTGIAAMAAIYAYLSGEKDRDYGTEYKEPGDETFEYFMTLDYSEQESYFKNNEYLREYIKNEYYPSSREYTARGAARIARIHNREFTNRYDRY